MAQLIVRDLPAELVAALKLRAAKRNRSAEQLRLDRSLAQVTRTYGEAILPLDEKTAQVWGRLRVTQIPRISSRRLYGC